VDTPIHVAHHLDMDIHFSTRGVDARGVVKRDGSGSAGGVRVLRIRRKVMLPNVSLGIHGNVPGGLKLIHWIVLYPAKDRSVAGL
jgi:hypothetical protein